MRFAVQQLCFLYIFNFDSVDFEYAAYDRKSETLIHVDILMYFEVSLDIYLDTFIFHHSVASLGAF